MNGYKISSDIDFEYNRMHQMVIKVKKTSKKWIFLVSKLLESDNFK